MSMDFNKTLKILYPVMAEEIEKKIDRAKLAHKASVRHIENDCLVRKENERRDYELKKAEENNKKEKLKQSIFRNTLFK